MKVELIASTPNPDGICARGAGTCVNREIPAEGKETGLRRALESGHESVAEHAVFTFAVSGISRACSHQLVRHRLASYSQQSQRYVDMEDFEYVIPQSIAENKRKLLCIDDSDGNLVKTTIEAMYDEAMKEIGLIYRMLTDSGVPEEDARYVLPNACATNIIVTVNARELRHMAEERMCSRAQWEIRELVSEMVRLAEEKAPVLFDDAGPKCIRLGCCPEEHGCGRTPRREQRWRCPISPKQKAMMAVEKRQRVADALDRHPEGLTSVELIESTGLTPSELSYALDSLSRFGRVERVWRRA